MDELSDFLNEYVPPERSALIVKLYNLLNNQGVIEHQIVIDDWLVRQANTEIPAITMGIESELIHYANTYLLRAYIVTVKDGTLVNYIRLIEFLNRLENSVESNLILSTMNENLTAIEQLLHWIELMESTIYNDMFELIVDVRDRLIDNIRDIHENRAEITPVAYPPGYEDRIKRIKLLYAELPTHVTDLLVSYTVLRRGDFKQFYTVDELTRRYSTMVNKSENDSKYVAIDVIAFALMSEHNPAELSETVKAIASKWYVDTYFIMDLMGHIEHILKTKGELCAASTIL
jgi:hypothetical protein